MGRLGRSLSGRLAGTIGSLWLDTPLVGDKALKDLLENAVFTKILILQPRRGRGLVGLCGQCGAVGMDFKSPDFYGVYGPLDPVAEGLNVSLVRHPFTWLQSYYATGHQAPLIEFARARQCSIASL